MNISLSINGCYWEHKIYFDEMARAMQAAGHKVGVIAGMRVKEYLGTGKVRDNVAMLEKDLGFKPDFMHLWGENETIANGNLWKCEKMDQEDVLVHFDDDAFEMKKYTGRWIFKNLNSGQLNKF